MQTLSPKDKAYCDKYLTGVRHQNSQIQTGQDTAKSRDENIKKHSKRREYWIDKKNMKSPGADIITTPALDQFVIKTYNKIPKPKGRKYEQEDNFLVFKRGGVLTASKVFQMPQNGGKINYTCNLGYIIDWPNVVAAAHTHPLYDDKSLDRLNKYFSPGDPTILLARQIPLYLRTPKGKDIKVMEIRNGWITTREADQPGSKAKKWIIRQ